MTGGVQFLIADTFTASLARLEADEQKLVKTTAFDMQVNPANPGHQLHKLDGKDKSFWSVRVGSDLRIIVHKTPQSLLLCYVDHHDKAYAWAERRKLETHPTTGAAQLVEIREHAVDVIVKRKVPEKERTRLAQKQDAELLAVGVPLEWIADVKEADEEGLLRLCEHLPSEAAEALLELATGGRMPAPTPAPAPPTSDPFAHPDALRRFRLMDDVEELRRALDEPWHKWTTFLHPAQRGLVEKAFAGPARVAGSAGTGKTIVALHRAVHLAKKHEDARVLLTTFSASLASALRVRLRRLIGQTPKLGDRIVVEALPTLALRLFTQQFGPANIASRFDIETALAPLVANSGNKKLTVAFVRDEFDDLVDAWQLVTWESYKDARRVGRKSRLNEAARKQVWDILTGLRTALIAAGKTTSAEMHARLTTQLASRPHPPFDFVVLDEAQDASPSQLRLLAAMGASRRDALFFAGDLGQRIFQTAFSWKDAGVDVRGRSKTLTVNYRTSHQIRSTADQLLDSETKESDGDAIDRRSVSVFNGAAPVVRECKDIAAEKTAVAQWINERLKAGTAPHEIGVFVRSKAQLERAIKAAGSNGQDVVVLDDKVDTVVDCIAVGTMHLAKGLEFKAVVVMACDDGVLPLAERIKSCADEADLQEVYDTERHLLYVVFTRARDDLFVSGVTPVSEFLGDLGPRRR